MAQKNNERDAATLAAVRELLGAALGSAMTPTGTPLAHALNDLYGSEVRQVGRERASGPWLALDRDAIEEIACQLVKLTGRGGRDFTLPAGCEMVGVMGSVLVGAECLGFDVDRPGLHRDAELPSGVGGTNLALLLDLIARASSSLPCAALGQPILIERFDGRRLVQILRYPAFAGAAGTSLQVDLGHVTGGAYFCGYSREDVESLAESIVADATLMWEHGSKLAPNVERARAAGERVAAASREVSVHAVIMEFSGRRSARTHALSLEFGCWDHAFRRGVIAQEYAPFAYPTRELDADALNRADRVELVQRNGADGWIGGLARAIAMASPRGAPAVLKELAKGYETSVALQSKATGDRFEFRLHWRDGEIVADTRTMEPVEIEAGSVRIYGAAIPDTAADALAGRPLHALFSEPFRCATPIASVINNPSYNRVEATLRRDMWLVDCQGGRTWRMKPGRRGARSSR